ncbi:MAG: hypothetical protein K5842_05610 [Bacteroidales bacterium]|nr:hypothetical protein [Bacteroidales bacterium]
MKQLITIAAALLLVGVASAQVDRNDFDKKKKEMQERFNQQKNQSRQNYDDARKKAEEEFAAFRKKANEEYAAAMQRAWQRMDVQPAMPMPEEPTPPKPPAPPAPDKKPTTEPLPQADVKPIAVPKPVVPAPPVPAPEPTEPSMRFFVYGISCSVHTNVDELGFKLTSVDEKGAAEAWKLMSQKKYDGLLHDCLERRDELHLGDWGYMRILQAAAEKLLGAGSNEAVLLQMYLLTQSGYNVRLAKVDGQFTLLMPFSRKVHSYSYTIIGDLDYFILTKTKSKSKSIEVCNVGFPREQVADIRLAELPILTGKPQPKRTFAGERFGTMKASVGVDKSIIDFMNDYPVSDAWDYYALAGLSDVVKKELYPALRDQIEGKSAKKAALMLLDFVQHAFEYATDQEQFGYERPLFADESFYYPQNDCEDRSIVYSILVRDLLGLKVALVHWKGHLATAVAFPEEVEGDYFTIDGIRYTVCDPTYIGAGIGMTMPQFKNVKANLIKL